MCLKFFRLCCTGNNLYDSRDGDTDDKNDKNMDTTEINKEVVIYVDNIKDVIDNKNNQENINDNKQQNLNREIINENIEIIHDYMSKV